jgi:hypothetical protein
MALIGAQTRDRKRKIEEDGTEEAKKINQFSSWPSVRPAACPSCPSSPSSVPLSLLCIYFILFVNCICCLCTSMNVMPLSASFPSLSPCSSFLALLFCVM